jgi:hypothetical protein
LSFLWEVGILVSQLRPYRIPKAKKSFLAITQGCSPLSPIAVKPSGRRNADARTTFSLEVLNVSSLERLRSVLYHEETTQEVISKTYLDWVSNNQYMIFEQKRYRSPIRQIASLIPKRGNIKYAYRVRRKFREFILPFEYEKKKAEIIAEGKTRVLFLTLTFDPSICDFKTGWDSVAYFWNCFMASVRRHFGRVLSARCFESSEKGFPHIHCVLYFENSEFPTFLKWSRAKRRFIWRIPFPEVEKFRELWHSFIDVQGMTNLADGLNYLSKYISKGTDLNEKGSTTTLSLTWAFRKRAYSLGTKFKEAIFQKYLELDLTRISVTQTVSEQMTLDSDLLRDLQPSFLRPWFEKWVNKGIIEKSNLKRFGGIPKGCFSFGLCDSQKAFSVWYFNR